MNDILSYYTVCFSKSALRIYLNCIYTVNHNYWSKWLKYIKNKSKVDRHV